MQLRVLLLVCLPLALLAPLAAQSPSGIAVPSMLFSHSGGAWSGHPCPQPGAWNSPTAATVPSGNTATARAEFFRSAGASPYLIAIAAGTGTPLRIPGITGPLLLDPGSLIVWSAGSGGALPGIVGRPCGYGDFGIAASAAVPLPRGSMFVLQGLTPDVAGGAILTPLIVVTVS